MQSSVAAEQPSAETANQAVEPSSTARCHASAGKPYPWILHPAIDMFLCCGGVLWILFAVQFGADKFHLPLSSLPYPLLAIMALLGTHAFAETHIVATLARVYKDADSRERFAIYTRWAALAFAGLCLVCLNTKPLVGILGRIYLLWVIPHFTSQTYGLTLLYCFKGGYPIDQGTKRRLSLFLNSVAAMAMIRQLTYKDWSGNGFLAQQIPMWGPLPEWIFQASVLAVVFAGAVLAYSIGKIALLEHRFLPLPAACLLATGVGIFCCSTDVAKVAWVYVPAFFHGSQYVVVSAAHYLKERGLPEGTAPSQMWRLLGESNGISYLLTLAAGALTLYIGVPRLLQELGFDYSIAFASVFVCLSLHHFVTDQAIWKLRDPKLRNALVH